MSIFYINLTPIELGLKAVCHNIKATLTCLIHFTRQQQLNNANSVSFKLSAITIWVFQPHHQPLIPFFLVLALLIIIIHIHLSNKFQQFPFLIKVYFEHQTWRVRYGSSLGGDLSVVPCLEFGASHWFSLNQLL